MRARLIALVVVVFAVGLLVPGVASADDPPLEEIYESTILIEDHLGGFVVKGPNVTLDCDGFQILPPIGGPPPDDNFGILIEGQSGVTVENCRISGFQHGVGVTNSRDISIQNTSVVAGTGDYRAFGFVVGTYPPFQSEDVTLTGNEATGGWIGFMLDNAERALIQGNRAIGAAHSGIAMFDVEESALLGNEAVNNEVGFRIIGSDYNMVTDNGAVGSRDFGFLLMNSNENGLYRNTATGSAVTGFDLGGSHDNTVRHNSSTANGHSGFSLWLGSTGNTLEFNFARANQVNGFFILDGEVVDNTLAFNKAIDNGAWGIEDATDGGTGDQGTDNRYHHNVCVLSGIGGSTPDALCVNRG
jgi:parallel beta-helix repeat protein